MATNVHPYPVAYHLCDLRVPHFCPRSSSALGAHVGWLIFNPSYQKGWCPSLYPLPCLCRPCICAGSPCYSRSFYPHSCLSSVPTYSGIPVSYMVYMSMCGHSGSVAIACYPFEKLVHPSWVASGVLECVPPTSGRWLSS